MSPKFKAILKRLNYVGEYLFGGNMETYAASLCISEHWLRHILREKSRLRVPMFAQFVESGIVSAEWLFCGSGPMLKTDPRHDAVASYSPSWHIHSAMPCVDTTLLGAAPLFEVQPFITPDEYVATKEATVFLPLARATFHSRSNNKPVILFLNADVICAGVTPIINVLLKQKVVTHIAMTSAAAEVDFQIAIANKADLTGLPTALRMAADAGVGFAEGVARWAFTAADNRADSILATAYDLGATASVHTNFGDAHFQLSPAIGGAEFGAILGAVSYIDMLAFTQKVFDTTGDPPGTFIVAGSARPGLALLSSVIAAGHRLPEPLDFSALKIGRLSSAPGKQNLDFFVSGSYRDLFPQFLDICSAVYTSKFERFLYDRYGHKLLERKPAAQPD